MADPTNTAVSDCSQPDERERERLRLREYYLRNRAAYIAKSRARRLALKAEDPEGLREYNRRKMKEWRDNNLEKVRKRRRESVAARRAADPGYALNSRIGNAMRVSIRKAKAGRKWEQLVGYSLADLRRHLERQFLKDMSWENMSEWHIDHIVPLSSFKWEEPGDQEFRAAWALTNLRPLWKMANLTKGAKVLTLI